MAWLWLVAAGLFEIGWPLGFKLAQMHPRHSTLYILLSAFCMALSGGLLYLAQREIPMGTAYIVWTGIGGLGTVVIGILFFQDSASLTRLFFIGLILAGVLGLKLTH